MAIGVIVQQSVAVVHWRASCGLQQIVASLQGNYPNVHVHDNAANDVMFAAKMQRPE